MAMRNLTEQSVSDAVRERFAECPDPRLNQIFDSLIRHLHEFAREIRLTPAEWMAGINFLTAVGHITDEKRQEFILLSDTLGLSALVDILQNGDKPEKITESSLLGPFFREGAPEMPFDADIAGPVEGERVILHGRVTSIYGDLVPNAMLDVWQAGPNGLYDLQDENQPEMNLRARLRTDSEGRYRFRSIKPASYPVPTDGPVGKMLNAVGRHPFRPAHIHFLINAPGYETLTTALYIDGDAYLDSDAVFGSRKSLVVGYSPFDDDADRVGNRQEPKVDSIKFDFVLNPKRK
jgi:hydroxyquinol 1,2-dioxygenase